MKLVVPALGYASLHPRERALQGFHCRSLVVIVGESWNSFQAHTSNCGRTVFTVALAPWRCFIHFFLLYRPPQSEALHGLGELRLEKTVSMGVT